LVLGFGLPTRSAKAQERAARINSITAAMYPIAFGGIGCILGTLGRPGPAFI